MQHDTHDDTPRLTITPGKIRSALKSDLVEIALDLLAECIRLEDEAAHARGLHRSAESDLVDTRIDLAAAEARVRALEECGEHDRRRLDTLTGAERVTGLDGYDLEEILDAMSKLTRRARR